MAKIKPSLIGLLQAIGAAAYCALISGIFWGLKGFQTPPQFITSVFMLFLLVFSAAVTGSIIFGYAAYLAANQKIREALSVLAYTLLYSLILIFIIVAVILMI